MSESVQSSTLPPVDTPSLTAALPVWLRIGLLSFGGPAGQIALMHRMLVDERRWIGEESFLHGLNFCMLLPGPEAQQLATYVGWRMHGIAGGLVAGLLFILPGAAVIFALSVFYMTFQEHDLVTGVFFGIKAAVVAIVLEALRRISKKALKTRHAFYVAGAAFLAVFLFGVAFPIVVAAAALTGFVSKRTGQSWFVLPAHGASDNSLLIPARTMPLRTGLIAGVSCFALWLVPVGILVVIAPGNIFTDLAVFFSQMSLVTFGGAYAVLTYVAQQAVDAWGWLTAGEMVDGLGLAETTPGPLVLVLQFVGYIAAMREAMGMGPVLAGFIGSLIVLWTTFLPCFAWIFLGGPFIDRLGKAPSLSSALAAVTAAVVGVILNLSLWFAAHVVFRETMTVTWGPFDALLPVPTSVEWYAVALALASIVALHRFKLSVPLLLAAASLAGLGLGAAGVLG